MWISLGCFICDGRHSGRAYHASDAPPIDFQQVPMLTSSVRIVLLSPVCARSRPQGVPSTSLSAHGWVQAEVSAEPDSMTGLRTACRHRCRKIVDRHQHRNIQPTPTAVVGKIGSMSVKDQVLLISYNLGAFIELAMSAWSQMPGQSSISVSMT